MDTNLYKKLEDGFGATGLEVKNKFQAFIQIKKDSAVALISHLKMVEGYKHLSFFTAVDQIEKGVFELMYMLHNYNTNQDLCIVVHIDRIDAEMQSIHHLWPAIETYQRELREMFGINFPGSPRVMDNFCLEGWDNTPPMRREFDTKKFCEETFYERPGRKTHDPTEYMKEKLYPSEAETW